MEDVERFVQLFNYPLYEVSSYGYVRNISSGRKLRMTQNVNGSMIVCLRHQGKNHIKTVARLVAEEFVAGYEPDHQNSRWPKNTPIHLDHNKENCRADNLKWMPRWAAIKWEQEWRDGPSDQRPVLDTRTAKEYPTAFHCAQELGILEHNVLMSCNDFNWPQRYQFVGVAGYKTIEDVRGY